MIQKKRKEELEKQISYSEQEYKRILEIIAKREEMIAPDTDPKIKKSNENYLEIFKKYLTDKEKILSELISYRTDEKTYIEVLEKIFTDIKKEIIEEEKKDAKYKNIKPENIKVIISGTKLEKENIESWVDEEYFFQEYSDEIKEKIKKFVEDLWDQGKIYQPRRDNKIDLNSWGPYLPHSGLYTQEEFKKETCMMLNSAQAIVRNLETFKNLFPEEFSEITAQKAFDIYVSNSEKEYKHDNHMLLKFDEIYQKMYPERQEKSTADEILNGTKIISFTTPSSDEKIK